MCGICGIINFERDNQVSEQRLMSMRDVLTHRGPDDEGLYSCGNVGMGFRRLSIVDLEGGHQPMCNEDGSVWIVFNGEIYNHADLRSELVGKGHLFKTRAEAPLLRPDRIWHCLRL